MTKVDWSKVLVVNLNAPLPTGSMFKPGKLSVPVPAVKAGASEMPVTPEIQGPIRLAS